MMMMMKELLLLLHYMVALTPHYTDSGNVQSLPVDVRLHSMTNRDQPKNLVEFTSSDCFTGEFLRLGCTHKISQDYKKLPAWGVPKNCVLAVGPIK